MSLLRLADVELQLVMHGLSSQELLQFARCSRRLLHAADSAFAWTHTSARLSFECKARSRFQLFSRQPSVNSFAASPAHPLRHSRPILQLGPSSQQLSVACARRFHLPLATPGDLAALSSSLALHSALQFHELEFVLDPFLVDKYGSQLDDRRWLVPHFFQSLRVIRMKSQFYLLSVGSESVEAMSTLPHLHTLEFRTVDVRSLELLPRFPALTTLRLLDSCGAPFTFLGQCSHLTRIELGNAALEWKHVASLFASPLLQRNLQWLGLHQLSDADQSWGPQVDPTAEDYAAAFRSMLSLHTLELGFNSDPNLLLSQLVHAPALRLLVCGSVWDAHVGVPSAEVVTALLSDAPNLHCTIRLDASGANANGFAELQRSQATLIRQRFKMLLEGDRANARFTVEL